MIVLFDEDFDAFEVERQWLDEEPDDPDSPEWWAWKRRQLGVGHGC